MMKHTDRTNCMAKFQTYLLLLHNLIMVSIITTAPQQVKNTFFSTSTILKGLNLTNAETDNL